MKYDPEYYSSEDFMGPSTRFGVCVGIASLTVLGLGFLYSVVRVAYDLGAVLWSYL